MANESSWLKKAKFLASVAVVYILTVAFIGYSVRPFGLFDSPGGVRLTSSLQKPTVPTSTTVDVISGLPVRIVIPSEQIDLPLVKGYFDSSTDSWTLTGYDAQFAMFSSLANNAGGNTFLYGHNNDFVFGALRHHTPLPGAQALIYTDNGHIFSYTFQTVTSVAPDDVSYLNYRGSPIMTIQTCTGSLNEWRTMYKFNFSGVLQ